MSVLKILSDNIFIKNFLDRIRSAFSNEAKHPFAKYRYSGMVSGGLVNSNGKRLRR